jgi:quaternary ammonium compound-resistance protein SugE
MAWLVLIAAGLVEIAMAMALKYAVGWTRVWPSVLGITFALASIFLLTHAVKSLPVTTAYAVWTGIGAVGVSVVGIILFNESAHPLRLACIGMVFAGIVGLHLLEGRA